MVKPVIVFDWGNTLMKVFPQYSGAMKNWPEVQAVEGARAALEALHGRYRLVVGTNAADSNAEQIMAALERVGLAEWVECVYTYQEIGSRKPAEQFFYRLEELLAVRRDDVCMVGDEFKADVLGPARAGWRAVWLNPGVRLAPGLLPLHNAEIQSLAELPARVDELNLPAPACALSWLQEMGTTQDILIHVQMVAGLAYFLAAQMLQQGLPVDPVLAHRGGLLHDVAKLSANRLPGGPDHGQAAAQHLLKRGQPALAEIANRHLLFCIQEPERAPRSWEEKLVYFTDKLVEGGSVVPIPARLQALAGRYPRDAQQIMDVEPALNDLQAEITGVLGWKPDELLPRLKQALWQEAELLG